MISCCLLSIQCRHNFWYWEAMQYNSEESRLWSQICLTPVTLVSLSVRTDLVLTSWEMFWGLRLSNVIMGFPGGSEVMLQGSQNNSQIQWFNRKSYRTQHIVVFMTNSCWSKWIQKKNQQKVKSTCDKVKRNPDTSVQESLPSGVIQILIPSASNCDNTCTEPSIRQTLEGLCAQSFIKDWSHGHTQPLPKFQTPRSKTGALHKPHCLHKQNGHRGPLFC